MFHRFRIGSMDAMIVSDGPLALPRAARIFSGPDEAAIDAALGGAGVATDKVQQVEQNCLLLQTGGTWVLFDNGMGSSKLVRAGQRQVAGQPGAGGHRSGGDRCAGADARAFDHCWGTMRDDGQPNYPNATIYMAEDELAFWESNPPGERRERSLAGVRKHLLPLRDRIVLIRGGQEFLPGVQAWATPGHTPGHMAYLLSGGWCLTGDVAFHDPLSFAFPEAASTFDTDPAEAAATRRILLGRLADEKLAVIGYHYPWPGLGRVERVGGTFRFVQDSGV